MIIDTRTLSACAHCALLFPCVLPLQTPSRVPAPRGAARGRAGSTRGCAGLMSRGRGWQSTTRNPQPANVVRRSTTNYPSFYRI